jgi:hypothetical protein
MADTAEPSDFEIYQVVVEQTRAETDHLWQQFTAFFIPQAVLLGFGLQVFFGVKNGPQPFTWIPGAFFPAMVGVLLAIPWFISHARAAHMYRFRMAQARVLEDAVAHARGITDENDSRRMFRQGKSFTEGKRVELDGEFWQIPLYARLNNSFLVRSLVVGWMATDVIMAAASVSPPVAREILVACLILLPIVVVISIVVAVLQAAVRKAFKHQPAGSGSTK